MTDTREELIRWVLDVPQEITDKLANSTEDLKRPFGYLLRNTEGIAGGLHNDISDGLKKAVEDPRSLVQQVHDDVGDIVQWCVDFDAPINETP